MKNNTFGAQRINLAPLKLLLSYINHPQVWIKAFEQKLHGATIVKSQATPEFPNLLWLTASFEGFLYSVPLRGNDLYYHVIFESQKVRLKIKKIK